MLNIDFVIPGGGGRIIFLVFLPFPTKGAGARAASPSPSLAEVSTEKRTQT